MCLVNQLWSVILLGFTTPCSSIFVTSTSTTLLSTSEMLLNGCCTGCPSVRIECLTASVRPTGLPLATNKSANWAKRFWSCVFYETVKSEQLKLKSGNCDWSVWIANTSFMLLTTSIRLCWGVASLSFIPL